MLSQVSLFSSHFRASNRSTAREHTVRPLNIPTAKFQQVFDMLLENQMEQQFTICSKMGTPKVSNILE
jgi:hypothetical protein